jgi:hypothetical protein
MTDKQPFIEQFDCPRAKGPVQIRGVEVTLRGSGGMPIDAARRYSDCSGSPACGTKLGEPNCPYTTSRHGT